MSNKLKYICILYAIAICVSYILARDIPAGLMGFFFEGADAILQNGFRLPERIPKYTEHGVPFAYPPLGFYILAILNAFGLEYTIIALYYPPIIFFICSVLSYYMVRRLTDDELAGVSAIAFMVGIPLFLGGHVTAGGVVRATALLFSMLSILSALRIEGKYNNTNLVLVATFTSLAILTHPVYGLFTIVSVVTLNVTESDKDIYYAVREIVVTGAISFVIITPWLYQVIEAHGVSVFLNASGSQGGILNIGMIYDVLLGEGSKVLVVVVYISVVMITYFLWVDWEKAIWPLAILLLIPVKRGAGYTPVSVYLTASFYSMIGLAGADVVIRNWFRLSTDKIKATISIVTYSIILIMACLYTTGMGDEIFPQIAHKYDTLSGPRSVTKEDIKNHKIAGNKIKSINRAVVVGNNVNIEVFPYFSGATILWTQFGTEWLDYETRSMLKERISIVRSCNSLECVFETVDGVYVEDVAVVIPDMTNQKYNPREIKETGKQVLFKSGSYYVFKV